MSKYIPHVIIVLLVVWIFVSGNGFKDYKYLQEEKINNLKEKQLQYKNEIDCLDEEIIIAKEENKDIIIIDNAFKNKYYDAVRENAILEERLLDINSLVLSYKQLDSLAGVVEYTQDR